MKITITVLPLLLVTALTGCLDLRRECTNPDAGDSACPAPMPTATAGQDGGLGSSSAPDAVADLSPAATASDSSAEASSDGGTAPALLGPVDGARLKARSHEARPGYGVFAGWYDSQLKQSCAFMLAGDGQLRCVPGSPEESYYELYLDAGCTKKAPIYGSGGSPCAKVPTVIRRDEMSTLTGCPSIARAHRVRPVNRAEVFSKDATSGLCGPATDIFTSTDRLYTVEEELSPVSFVKGVDEVAPATPNALAIELHRIAGEDGSKGIPGFRDRVTKDECNFDIGADGRAHCLPTFKAVRQDKRFSSPGFGGYDHYSDPTCSTYVAHSLVRCEVRPPKLALISKTDVCPIQKTWVSLGPVVQKAYVANNGVCEAVVSDPSVRFNELGAPTSIETFPSVGHGIDEAATGPLRMEFRILPDGRRVSTGRLFDKEANGVCDLVNVGEGRFRCVPGNIDGFEAQWFADATCTKEPLHTTWGGSCPVSHAVFDDSSNCSESKLFFSVGAAYRGPVFTRVKADGIPVCTPGMLPANYVAYSLAPLSASRFPEVTTSNPP
jgi:hypothetical protein